MLKVDDIRQTRVYTDAQEEGRQEGREEERQRQMEEKKQSIRKLAQLNIAPDKIADAQLVDVEFVRNELSNSQD